MTSILKHLQSNEQWKPTNTLYFRKYTHKITIGPVKDWAELVSVEKPHRQKCQHRHNAETDQYDIYNTIYTNDPEFLLDLANNYDYTLITSPINEEHADMLQNTRDNKILIREKNYYGQYKYKIEVYGSWRVARNSWQEDIIKARKWMQDNIDSTTSKFVYVSGWRNEACPLVYTNDIQPVMLLKLAWSDVLHINVTEVITYNDLKG